MHVRRNRRRIIESADADETERLNSCIFAPHGGLTDGAAKNPMRPAAVGEHATRRSSPARLLSSRSIRIDLLQGLVFIFVSSSAAHKSLSVFLDQSKEM